MTRGFLNAVGARLFATVSAFGTGVLSLWVYKSYLTPDSYGVVLVALQVLAFLPLLDGGFRTTINRALLARPAEPERRRLLRFGQVLYSWLGLGVLGVALLLMVGYAFTPAALASGQRLPFFLALGLVGALAMLTTAQSGLLVGLEAQAALHLITAVNAWVNAGALWLALDRGAGLWAFPLAMLAAVAISATVALRLVRRRVPGLRWVEFAAGDELRAQFRELGRDAWACFRSQVSMLLLFTVDVVIVGLVCGAREAAVYGVLTRLIGIVRGVLHVTGEAAWPVIAGQPGDERAFTDGLLRLNAWTHGAVAGALAITLPPFLGRFMGEAWVAPPLVFGLVMARFLITGVTSPVPYFLVGRGQFAPLARLVERELAVAVALALALGAWRGLPGVAAAFLCATAVATSGPMVRLFTRPDGIPLGGLLARLWWRSAVALGVSLAVAWVWLPARPDSWQCVGAGAGAALAALGCGLGIACLRVKQSPLPALRLGAVLQRL